MNRISKLLILASFLFAATLSAVPLPVYRLPVKVTCATHEAAEGAQLSFLPFPEGKKVAFSCRWDDSNARHLAMRNLLKKHGYRATFYLTESGRKEFWSDVFSSLCSDGFTVGNHTRGHLELALLTPNAVHNEILGWSILLETRANQPINAFVLPYGKYNSPLFSGVPELIGSCLRRGGLLGGPDATPAMLKHLKLSEIEYFGTRLVRPGDRNTSAQKFDEDVRRHLASKESPLHLTLGIHTLHSDKDLQVLETSLKRYAGNPDWWYCNENEYLAYRYLVLHARVLEKKVTGSTAEFLLELPCPELLGSDIPLWAECDGQRFPIPHTRKSPTSIGIAAPNGKCARFPGLTARLLKTDENHLRLELENSGPELENLLVTLRLPPDCKEEVIYRQIPKLTGKLSLDWEVTRLPAADSMRRLTACQLDFARQGTQGRVWTMLMEQIPTSLKSDIQLHYTSTPLSEEEQLQLSKAETPLPEKTFVPAFTTPNYREGVYLVKLPTKLTPKDTLVAALDFQGGKPFTLRGELPARILFNGEPVTPKGNRLLLEATPAGACRLILVYPPAKRPPRHLILLHP